MNRIVKLAMRILWIVLGIGLCSCKPVADEVPDVVPVASLDVMPTPEIEPSLDEQYGFLTHPDRVDRKVYLSSSVLYEGKCYCIMGYGNNELWVFDGSLAPRRLIGVKDFAAIEAQATTALKYEIGMEYGNHTPGIGALAIANDRLFFSFSNGRASCRLCEYTPDAGVHIIEGVTSLARLTSWGDRVVCIATDDQDVRGLYTVGADAKPTLLLECDASNPNFLTDGVLYGRAHELPIVNSSVFVRVNGIPSLVPKSGEYGAFSLPHECDISCMAESEAGVFMIASVGSSPDIHMRLESDARIVGYNRLPAEMRGINPTQLKSIDHTVYFNLQSEGGDIRSLYYRSEFDCGDLTAGFAEQGIRMDDVISKINSELIIGKRIRLDTGSVNILQSYYPATKKLSTIYRNGKPMTINPNSGTFRYNDYLYFSGGDEEYENALWRYDGFSDPTLVEVSFEE